MAWCKPLPRSKWRTSRPRLARPRSPTRPASSGLASPSQFAILLATPGRLRRARLRAPPVAGDHRRGGGAGLALANPQGFEAVPGKGIRAQVEGHAVLVGKPEWLEAEGVPLGNLTAEVERLQAEAKTAIAVAVDRKAAGVLGVAQLHGPGLEVVMLTGDNRRTFSSITVVSNSLRLRRVRLQASPALPYCSADGRRGVYKTWGSTLLAAAPMIEITG